MDNPYTAFWLRLLHTPEADRAAGVRSHYIGVAGDTGPQADNRTLSGLTPDQYGERFHTGSLSAEGSTQVWAQFGHYRMGDLPEPIYFTESFSSPPSS